MKILLKYIWLLLILSGISNSIVAQETNKQDSDSSEVVMTVDELQSFLQKIAAYKAQETERKRKELRLRLLELEAKYFSYQSVPVQDSNQALLTRKYDAKAEVQPNPAKEEKAAFEFNLIQKQLDSIMTELKKLNAGGKPKTSTKSDALTEKTFTHTPEENNLTRLEEQIKQNTDLLTELTLLINNKEIEQRKVTIDTVTKYIDPQISNIGAAQLPVQNIYLNAPKINPPAPVIIYQDRVIREPVIESKSENDSLPVQPSDTIIISSVDSLALILLQDQQIQENRNRFLDDKLNMIYNLIEEKERAAIENQKKYQQDLSDLTDRIAKLTAELEKSNRDKTTVTPLEKPEAKNDIIDHDNIQEKLRSHSFNIYFSNNSIQIPATDTGSINKMSRFVKENPRVSIIIEGFASKRGNQAYNKQLALRRANQVKSMIQKNGISSSRTIIVNAGVDDTSDESEARRVEVILMQH